MAKRKRSANKRRNSAARVLRAMSMNNAENTNIAPVDFVEDDEELSTVAEDLDFDDEMQDEVVSEDLETNFDVAQEDTDTDDIEDVAFEMAGDLSTEDDEKAPVAEEIAPIEEATEKTDATDETPLEEFTPVEEIIEKVEVADETPADETPADETPAEEISEETSDDVTEVIAFDVAKDENEDVEEAPSVLKEEVFTEDSAETPAVEEVAPIEEVPEVAEITNETPAEEFTPVEELTEKTEVSDETPMEEVAPITANEEVSSGSEVTPTAQPKEETESADPVMDDEYMKAFMAEGEIDDFVYGGFAAKQDLLSQIADNAETLAEEGIELEEKKAEEEKSEEQLFNEKGEPITKDGKVILERTLENKLRLASAKERKYYNILKNEIMSYEDVKPNMIKSVEVFRVSKDVIARMSLAGGRVRMYYALNPNEYDIDRYRQAGRYDVDFEDTAMMLRVHNDDELSIAIELFSLMMGQRGANKKSGYINADFLSDFEKRENAILDPKGKMLSGEKEDEAELEKERRAEERRLAGLPAEEEAPTQEAEEEKVDEPPVILPLNLENKLHQTTNTIKLIYSKLKNELLSYKTVKSDVGAKNDTFRAGKNIIARMTVVADSLRLYLALKAEDLPAKKYKYRDASDQKGYGDTPLMLKIGNEKERLKAVDLIAVLMKGREIQRNKRYSYTPFAEKYRYIRNGIFKGDEDKPRVAHVGEEYSDIYGELTEHLRSQMGLGDAWGVPKGYKAEDGLSARDLLEIQRNKAKTLNAGIALATPIVYFYDVAINEEGEPQYVNVQQVLNDKFLGKMIPQEYFAIAESSTRIEELNFFALKSVVKDCNEHPELRFAVKISCRLLLKQETLTKLVEAIHTNNNNLILAFDCAMLEAVGFVGISSINTLKTQGALIMIDNAESASMRVLTEYDFDYLRLDARYYDGSSEKRLAHLDMITGYADVQRIITTSINCEHPEDARILLNHGVKVIQGDAVARPMRLIDLALKSTKPVPKVKETKSSKEG